MSTFGGLIEEFPGVSVDQFEGDNLNSTIYFLSHVHTDHMKGMNSSAFGNRLTNNKLVCYSSEVSTRMLRKWFPWNAANFRYLAMNIASHLVASEHVHFTVTLLPAAHCPGSVMMLFENDHHSVLYTGDFRLNVNEFRLFKGLYTAQNALKPITKIHLDTTFMLKRFRQFPSREDSLDALCTLIAEWIEVSPLHHVNLTMGCKYGGEYIISQVHQRFNMPIHVGGDTHDIYKHFPNMDECVTLTRQSQIHVHCNGFNAYCNQFDRELRTRYIKLTAMAWTEWAQGDSIARQVTDKQRTYYRVCYSSHCSLEEVQSILHFLRPNCIQANVVHSNPNDMAECRALMNASTCSNRKRKKKAQATNDCEIEENDDEYAQLIIQATKSKKEAVVEVEHGFDLSILD